MFVHSWASEKCACVVVAMLLLVEKVCSTNCEIKLGIVVSLFVFGGQTMCFISVPRELCVLANACSMLCGGFAVFQHLVVSVILDRVRVAVF